MAREIARHPAAGAEMIQAFDAFQGELVLPGGERQSFHDAVVKARQIFGAFLDSAESHAGAVLRPWWRRLFG